MKHDEEDQRKRTRLPYKWPCKKATAEECHDDDKGKDAMKGQFLPAELKFQGYKHQQQEHHDVSECSKIQIDFTAKSTEYIRLDVHSGMDFIVVFDEVKMLSCKDTPGER